MNFCVPVPEYAADDDDNIADVVVVAVVVDLITLEARLSLACR